MSHPVSEREHSRITFDINSDINSDTPKKPSASLTLSLEETRGLEMNILEI